MKKRMFAALLAVSMMIGMTACGSDNSSAGNSASGSSTETAKSDNAGSDSSYDVKCRNDGINLWYPGFICRGAGLLQRCRIKCQH